MVEFASATCDDEKCTVVYVCKNENLENIRIDKKRLQARFDERLRARATNDSD
jgi:hypothetical protein